MMELQVADKKFFHKTQQDFHKEILDGCGQLTPAFFHFSGEVYGVKYISFASENKVFTMNTVKILSK